MPLAPEPRMSLQDVVEFLEWMSLAGIQVWIDGGWGVDALLGEQTRPHSDLDIAVLHKDVPALRALLEARGFRDVPRDDSWECNFVLGDDLGRLIDIHSCTFDDQGNNVFGVAYPFESLQGQGVIAGQTVRCIPPGWMVKFHTGYPLDENDNRDVKALCQRFDIPIPPDYARFDPPGSSGLPHN